MDQKPVFVGIDVSKSRLDVAVRPHRTFFSVDHTDRGIASLLQRLAELHPQLVLLEATGGYETALVCALTHAELPVVVMNPRGIRDFARALGKLAKTDKIDAGILALYAETVGPEPRPLPDAAQRELAALVTRRRQLVTMITRERIAAVRPLPQCAPTSTSCWPPSKTSSKSWTGIWMTSCAKAPCGGNRTSSSKASPASARSSPAPYWAICRNWRP